MNTKIFTVYGGDLNGEIKYEIADFVNFATAGAGKIFEWEGFINHGISKKDMINAVPDLGRASTICPLDVVKEDDDYKIKISLKHPEHPEQKQTFEIHNLKVQYKF